MMPSKHSEAAESSTKTKGSEITFSDIENDCPHSSNRSPPLPNSSLAIPRTGRIHISISVDNVILFIWAGLAAVFFLVVLFNFALLFGRDATGFFKERNLYPNVIYCVFILLECNM